MYTPRTSIIRTFPHRKLYVLVMKHEESDGVIPKKEKKRGKRCLESTLKTDFKFLVVFFLFMGNHTALTNHVFFLGKKGVGVEEWYNVEGRWGGKECLS